MKNIRMILDTDYTFGEYFDSYDKKIRLKYEIWSYFPYIDANMNEDKNIIRFSIKKYKTNFDTNENRGLTLEDFKLFKKILPFCDIEPLNNNTSVLDINYKELLCMVKNRKRQLKLEKINDKNR